MPYFSKRDKKLTYEVTAEFWNAFKSYIIDLEVRGWFPDFSIWETNVDGAYWYMEPGIVNRKMSQELGKEMYPFEKVEEQFEKLQREGRKELTFDLIEFFFQYVQCLYDDNTYDPKKGRYSYTIKINKFFDNFRLAYKLEKGQVKDRHSEFFDKVIASIDFDIPDPETETMLNMAIDKFYSRNFEEQKIALNKLIAAYQRISSWEDDDKKNSIDKILDKISGGNEKIKDIFGEDCQELWKTVHIFLTRHAEKDKIPINDKDVLEYLFYACFNAIRFILKKYGYIKEYSDKREAEKESEGVPPEEDEELPF